METAARTPRVPTLVRPDVTITCYPRGVHHAFVPHRGCWGGGEVEGEWVGEVEVLPAVVPGQQSTLEGARAVTRNGRTTLFRVKG